MPSILFYLFAILMLAGGITVVAAKNPVTSALGMIGSFMGIAALLIGLNSYFIGILQILVYAGAIMVLFLFIIMLLDLKKAEKQEFDGKRVAAGVIIPALFFFLMIPVLISVTAGFSPLGTAELQQANEAIPASALPAGSSIRSALAAGQLKDVNLIGHELFNHFNLPLQIIAVLLLVATIGCVTLSKRLSGVTTQANALGRKHAHTLEKQTTIPQAPAIPAPAVDPAPAQEPATIEEPTSSEAPEPEQKTGEPLAENAVIDEKRGLIYTSAPTEADDLKVIKGVGPVLEKKLNEIGIYTYKQVADWNPEHVEEFDRILDFPGRIARDNWLAQATELYKEKYL